jgi:hypothetical protein
MKCVSDRCGQGRLGPCKTPELCDAVESHMVDAEAAWVMTSLKWLLRVVQVAFIMLSFWVGWTFYAWIST